MRQPAATPLTLSPKAPEATRTRVRSWLLLSLWGLCLAGCTSAQPATGVVSEFDGERALADVATQVAMGSRVPGTQAHREAADWILGQLQQAGWTTEVQEFEHRGVRLRNLIARAGPEAPGGILLGTHYDTRPQSDRDAVSPMTAVPGANDGASGVAVLLELARVLPKERLRAPLQLVFFDGEDSGRIDGWPWAVGSTEFVLQGENLPARVVIVDMVGDAELQLYLEKNSDPGLAAEIWAVASEAGMPAFIAEPGRKILDDHVPFLQAGIPAVDIIDIDYPYWHTTKDTLDKVSAASLAQVGETLLAWLEKVALAP
jgi:glutaminyl-peptide cyclotransferase